MFKKELRDIYKITLLVPASLLVITLAFLLKLPLEKFFQLGFVVIYPVFKSLPANLAIPGVLVFYALAVLVLANTLGLGAFKYEHKDRAFEYLLSFPFSKARLLMYKFLPRAAVLFLLTLFYEILAFYYIIPLRPQGGALFFLFDPQYLPLWVLFCFVTGFYLGFFEQKNWVAVLSLVTLMAAVFTTVALVRLLNFEGMEALHRNGICFALSLLLIDLLLGAGFLTVYKEFDLKSQALHSGRFVLFVLPALGLLLFGSVVVLV